MIYKKYIVIFFSIFGFINITYSEVWKITSLEWNPYSGKKLKDYGKSVQLLKNALKKEGIDLKVEFYPWRRSINTAKEAGYLGYFPAWPEEVKKGFIASNTIDWSNVSVIKVKGTKISYSSINELFRKYRVGLVKSYVYPEKIFNAQNKFHKNIEYSSTDTTLVKKLIRKKSDVIITDSIVANYISKKYNLNELKVIPGSVIKKELVIAVSNNSYNRKKIELINKIFK